MTCLYCLLPEMESVQCSVNDNTVCASLKEHLAVHISVPFWQLPCGIYSCSPYSSLEGMQVDHTKATATRTSKAIGLDKQNMNNTARASSFSVNFFAVTARLQRKSAYFCLLWWTWTQDNAFPFLFLIFDTVFWNSTPEKFANIWRSERDGTSAIT